MSAWRENIERAQEALRPLYVAQVSPDSGTWLFIAERDKDGPWAALDALTAQIEELEGERDHWIGLFEAEKADRVDAEQRVKELERERDSLVKQSLAQGAWMEGAMPNFSEVAEANARAEAAEQRVEELEGARNAAERMFAAAVYAMPDSEITVWPVHLEVDLTLERYDDPLNKCSRFRAALAQFDPPEDSE